MPNVRAIAPCLWFDTQAEEAARFYTAIFTNSKIVSVAHYAEEGREMHQKPPGSVMIVSFELCGQPFTALNGGPYVKFNEAISFQVSCDTQKELDYHWEKLGEGGDVNAQQCGWLKDKFGVSWQIVPSILSQIFSGSDPEGCGRAMNALMQMKKLDIQQLQQAYDG